jgi:serine/threonine-protein kinase HipA
MSVNGVFDGISRDDLLAVADRHRVPGAKAVISEVREAVDAWPDFGARAGLTTDRVEAIRATFPA